MHGWISGDDGVDDDDDDGRDAAAAPRTRMRRRRRKTCNGRQRPRAAISAAGAMKGDGNRERSRLPIGRRWPVASAGAANKMPCTATGLGKRCQHPLWRTSGWDQSMAPPCCQGRHARGNRSASGLAGWLRPCSRDMPSGTTACCAGLRCSYPPEGQCEAILDDHRHGCSTK